VLSFCGLKVDDGESPGETTEGIGLLVAVFFFEPGVTGWEFRADFAVILDLVIDRYVVFVLPRCTEEPQELGEASDEASEVSLVDVELVDWFVCRRNGAGRRLGFINGLGCFSRASLNGLREPVRCGTEALAASSSCSLLSTRPESGSISMLPGAMSPFLIFSSTIFCPTCLFKFVSIFLRLLLPLPLLARVVTPFLPCMNAADGGGAFIHALSSRFAGTELTTGGCNSFTGGMLEDGMYALFGFSGKRSPSATQPLTPTLEPLRLKPGAAYTISALSSTTSTYAYSSSARWYRLEFQNTGLSLQSTPKSLMLLPAVSLATRVPELAVSRLAFVFPLLRPRFGGAGPRRISSSQCGLISCGAGCRITLE
jgi:hypothetical protein